MCGIVAVLRARGLKPAPDATALLAELNGAVSEFAGGHGTDPLGALRRLAAFLTGLDAALRGARGVAGLLATPADLGAYEAVMGALDVELGILERRFEDSPVDAGTLEAFNAALSTAKDAAWAVERDRLRTARRVLELTGRDASRSSIDAFTSIQEALSAIDRMEVRGRDSAGLQVMVYDHGLALDQPALAAVIADRSRDPLFGDGSVRVAEGNLVFVYKAAAEIGELGDNTAALRASIAGDELLRRAVSANTARAVVVGHTRWASVGAISVPNAHPVNSDEAGRHEAPYVAAVLNGDVDNFADLSAAVDLRIPTEITTDAKVIPTLVSRALAGGEELSEAMRRTLGTLDGSVAIVAHAATAPDRLFVALRGSGQALYVGPTEEGYAVASEPYGLVELTNRYLRMDGETPSNPDDPAGSRGQLIELDADQAPALAGIGRRSYDGTELPVTEADLTTAEITTRDIDRGDFPHFLLKEITQAPESFAKTLRGRIVEADGLLRAVVGDDTFPPDLRRALADGYIDEVLVIGQGTAAIAGRAAAAAIETVCGDRLRARALAATELSGFGLRPDMSETLVVAISQSGTTTDTNRTVDLVRARGARVVAIVNRRNSDLVDKSDGVLYTADGRDVEMSVASTKAFYAQVAAGYVLADALASECGLPSTPDRHELLAGLRSLPAAMEATLGSRPAIGDVARSLAPRRRYWAIVGNGLNNIAANEIRIKLSELCYKAIACDATEDKKHIDLSSEPLILICAAGLQGGTADDVSKEIAIFRAHKAAPVVIASEGTDRFGAALAVLTVPDAHPSLGFVLATMVGHLFGYECALAIDEQARPLREARASIDDAVRASSGDAARALSTLRRQLVVPARRFYDDLRSGEYDGHLEASSAQRLSSAFRYSLGTSSLDTYQVEHGRIGTPSAVIEDLSAALTRGIDELTRPVDAIKHQAKTVTVGISRSDEGLLTVPLVAETLAAGAARDRLSYRTLRTLAALDPAVIEVTGFTRYGIEGDIDEDATITVLDRGGIAAKLTSRAETNPTLRGTKHRVATEQEVTVARGRSDGRTVLIVPEIKDTQPVGLTLLHIRIADRLPVETIRSVLQGYRGRYSAIKDAVTETEPTFREDVLAELPVVDVLTEPVYVLADQWRS